MSWIYLGIPENLLNHIDTSKYLHTWASLILTIMNFQGIVFSNYSENKPLTHADLQYLGEI